MKNLLFLLVFFGHENVLIAQCPQLIFNSAYQPTTEPSYSYSQGWALFNDSSCDVVDYHLRKYAVQIYDPNTSTWDNYPSGYTLNIGTTSPLDRSDPFTILAFETENVEVHFNFYTDIKGREYRIYFDIYPPNSNVPLNPLSGGRLWTSFFVPANPQPTIANMTVHSLGAPNSVVAGNGVNLTGIIENNGTASTGASNTIMEVWLSDNPTFSTTTDELLEWYWVSPLQPGGMYNMSVEPVIPAATPAGTYYLFVVTDASNDVAETDEDDNIDSISIEVTLPSSSLPNLIPADMNVPSIVDEGQNFTVSFSTQNASSNFMPYTTFTNRIYLSDDNILDSSSDPIIGSAPCSADLNPGETGCYLSASNFNNLSPGNYWIIFWSDSNNDVDETTNNDNTVAIPFTVRVPCQQGGPTADFTISGPNVIMEGETISTINTSSSATNYIWNVDNVSSYSSTNLNNVPLYEPGSTAITLTAYDACNNTDTETKYVTVQPEKTEPFPIDSQNGYESEAATDIDPVNMATGAFVTKLDMFPMDDITGTYPISAYYNSTSGEHTGLGYKWTFSFDVRLEVGDRQYLVHWPDGHKDYYVRYQDGSTEPLYNGLTDNLYETSGGGRTLEKPDGTKYKFDSGSNPVFYNIEDRNGNDFYISHYAYGKIRLVTFPTGRSMEFFYDANDYLTRIEADDGRKVYFVVDGTSGDLMEYINVRGDTMSFTYNGAHNILTKTDFKGTTVLTNTYDTYQRVVSQTDVYGEAHQLFYNTPVMDATMVVNPAGDTTIYYHDEYMRLYQKTDALGYSTYTTYDSTLHIPNGFTDEMGNTSSIIYDGNGNPLQITNALGNTASFTYGNFSLPLTAINLLGAATSFTRDANGNPTTVTLPNGSTISNTFDGQGALASYTTPNGHSYSITYDYNGVIIEIQTPSGNIHYTRDVASRVTAITDREMNTVQLVWDDRNIIEIVDAKGVSSYASYDANDNLLYQVDRIGDTTFYEYDLRDRLTKITNALGEQTQFFYNNLDLLVQVINARGDVVTYSYNTRQEMVASTNGLGTTTFAYNPSGDLMSYTTPDGHTYQIHYDVLHRPTAHFNPLGELMDSVTYNPAGQPSTILNQHGHLTSYSYTNMGWLSQVTDNIGGSNTMTFDNEGNILTVTDANGHTTTATYNEFGQAVTQITPNSKLTSITVDNEGNVTAVQRPDGTVNSFAYDENYNIVSSTFPTDTYLWGYNANDVLTSMSNTHGTTTFELDALSRIIKTTDVFGNVVHQGYDGAGNNIYTVYPSGDTLQTEYNSVGLATKITDWQGNSSDRTYNADGELTTITNSNSTSTQIIYDAASRIKTYKNFLGNGTLLNSHNLTRLPGGLISQDQSVVPLQPDFNTITENYTHNPDNEILTTTSKGFHHDLNGNRDEVTGASTETITWGELDLVTGYTRNGNSVSLKYNPLRHRIEKTAATETTRYALNMAGPMSWILEEHDGANNLKATNIYAPDGLAWRLDENGNASFMHFDYLGHTKGLTDENGMATDTYGHTSFGAFVNHNGASTQPFGFLGRYGITYEGDGHYQVRAREYDATTGSFWSKDALSVGLGNTQSSAYSYGMANPLMYVDIDGNMPLGLNPSLNQSGSNSKFGNKRKTEEFNRALIRSQQEEADFDWQTALMESFQDAVHESELLEFFVPEDALTKLYRGEELTLQDRLDLVSSIPVLKPLKLLKVVKAVKVGKAINVVYQGIDKSGVVRYIGITSRNPMLRFGEHLNSVGTGKEFLRYQVVPGASNLSSIKARIWEQTLINQYGLQKNGGFLLNKINSISPLKWHFYNIK